MPTKFTLELKADPPAQEKSNNLMTSRIREALLVLLLVVSHAQAAFGNELLAWETFRDQSIADNLYCVSGICSSDDSNIEFEIRDGELIADFLADAPYFLINSLTGDILEELVEVSVRARFATIPGEHRGLVGVGTDRLYWAAYGRPDLGRPEFDRANVNAGFRNNPFGSPENVAYDEEGEFEMVVQLDVLPDQIRSFLWRVDDPATVISAVVDAGDLHTGDVIEPGIPLIWGNLGGRARFKEVIVTAHPMGTGGDFNNDGVLDASDIDQLMAAIRNDAMAPQLNLTSDIELTRQDMTAWVHTAKRTYFGDANLDGEFNSADFVQVFSAGEFENGIRASKWSTGDWNGDGLFDSGDFVVAFSDGGYEIGVRKPTISVPESTSCVLWMLIFLVGSGVLKRWRA